MIKILFFIETIDGGGAEKVLRDLVNNMDKQKFDITVQTVWPCDPEKYLAPGIRYKSMYSVQNRRNTLRYRAEAAVGLSYALHIKDDYDIECAYLECGTTKLLSASTNKKAVKLAWVHCDLQKAMEDPAGFAKQTAGYYARYDKVVCVSKQGKQSFTELYGTDTETAIIYNTVDCGQILQKAEEPLKEIETVEHPLVVSVGRLSAPKHFMRLLRAHKTLLDQGVFHNLLIVGEGGDRPRLEQFIQENGLQDSVQLVGFQSNPYPYIKEADLLACSSIYECFSTFITEGLILGKPIVTTDVSGMRELLGDSEYGLITENEDEAFCEGLKKMLTDTALRENYAQKSALRGKDFSTEKLIKDTERFFEECINSRR